MKVFLVLAVVQYLQNAGIIAVNYKARDLGVTRHMREQEAKAICSELICVKVPSKNGKADLTKYRDAGCKVARVLQTFTPLLERASVDEAYLDITENVERKMQEMRENKFQLQASNFVNTHAIGFDKIGAFVQDVTSSVDGQFDDVPEEDRKSVASSKLRLLIGSAIVNEIRKAVKNETNYDCSAGIAHNKILAKLTAGMNKPNKQTILPIESIPKLFENLAVSKVKSLGGKMGEEVCSKLNVKTMADLLKFSENQLQQHLQPRVGSWLYLMARGIDLEKVCPKFMSKSIAVSKNFRGKNEISSVTTLKHWLIELAKEIVERLEKDAAEYNRNSNQLIVSFTQETASTRTVPLNGNPLNNFTAEEIADAGFEMIKKNSPKFLRLEDTVILNNNIKHLGITAGKFEENNAAGTSKHLHDLLLNHKKAATHKSPKIDTKSLRETTTVEPQTPLSKAEATDAISKYQMKSPKKMVKTNINEHVQVNEPQNSSSTPKANTTSSIESLKISQSFGGEFPIKGLLTLRHWIVHLLESLSRQIEEDSKRNNRAPKVITLKYQQLVGSNKKEHTMSFSLQDFGTESIDVGMIIESLKGTEGFLKDKIQDKGIQNPVIRLELSSSEFENGLGWNFKIKAEDTKATPIKHKNPLEKFLKPKKADKQGEVDDELAELLRIELGEDQQGTEADETYSHEAEPLDFGTTYLPEAEPMSETEDVDTNDQQHAALDEPNLPSTSFSGYNSVTEGAGPSYIETYAEFQADPSMLEILNPKKPCMECGKMIAELEMISHLDHHLAFEIANEQREEFRKQKKSLTTQPSPGPSAPKKVPKGKAPPFKPLANLINKYVVKKEEPSADEATDEDKVQCELCHKLIPLSDYISHLDYHFAQKLRQEEIKKPVKVESAKRKRPGAALKNLPKMKSMKSYFPEAT